MYQCIKFNVIQGKGYQDIKVVSIFLCPVILSDIPVYIDAHHSKASQDNEGSVYSNVQCKLTLELEFKIKNQ
jgi:hypothetical protein